MGKKILKFNSFFLIIISSICTVVTTIYVLSAIISEILSSGFIGSILLNMAFIAVAFILIYVLTIPTLISSINSLKYLKGKGSYKISIIFSVISLLLFIHHLFFFIYIDPIGLFRDFVTGEININLKIIIFIIIFVIYILPLIVNIIELFKLKNNLTFQELSK